MFGGPLLGLEFDGIGPNLTTGGGTGNDDGFLIRLLALKLSDSSDPRGEF